MIANPQIADQASQIDQQQDEGYRAGRSGDHSEISGQHELADRRRQKRSGRQAVEEHVPRHQPVPGRGFGHRGDVVLLSLM